MEMSDQVARNEWMCIFHARHGARASRFQGRANSKMRRYLRSKPMGGHLRSPGSIFPVRSGVCQSCANVFRGRGKQLIPPDGVWN